MTAGEQPPAPGASVGEPAEPETRTATERELGVVADSAESLDVIAPSQTIGRYMVLEQIGVGGMGQVYAAYDPKLDRRVALKLLRTRGSATARERLEREGRALARLSHPNVVTVHEVDEHEGRLLVAMEYVPGITLKQWLTANPPGEKARLVDALNLLIQAGRGLAAAHASRLVHRDFKPANVLVGSDGRVRVADFGLARSSVRGLEATIDDPDEPADGVEAASGNALASVTRTGKVLGTPAYMAPEQFGDGEIDSRSDLFSFCVTAWELLFGSRPFGGDGYRSRLAAIRAGRLLRPDGMTVPDAVESTLRKGLRLRPERRHAGISELLERLQESVDELGGGRPRKRGGWWKLGGAFLVVGACGFAVHRAHRARIEAACVEEGATIATVWNEASRQRLRAGVLATELPYAPTVADKVMPWLDDYARAWQDAAVGACRKATVSKVWSDEQVEGARWCLEERRVALSTLVSALHDADETAVRTAIDVSAELSSIEACVDEVSLASTQVPQGAELRARALEVRAELVRASHLRAAGEFADGLKVARAALERAEAIDWVPLTAEARLTLGELLGKDGEDGEAEAAYVGALGDAVRSGAWGVAASASVALIYTVGYRQQRFDQARVWGELSKATIARAGDASGVREVRRLRHLSAAAVASGDLAEAEEYAALTMELSRTVLGSEHPGMFAATAARGVVLLATGEAEESRILFEEALEIGEEAFGPGHPSLIPILSNLGKTHYLRGQYEQAIGLGERAISVAADGQEPAGALELVAIAHSRLGEPEEAKAAHKRVLGLRRLRNPNDPNIAGSLLNLGAEHIKLGEFEDAARRFTEALAIWEEALGSDHPNVAQALSNRGEAYLRLGRYEDAVADHTRAVAIKQAKLGEEHPSVAFSLNGLGQALVALGRYGPALAHLNHAVAIRSTDDVAPELRAHSQFALAKALWDAPRAQGRDRTRARELAVTAREAFSSAGAGEGSDHESVVGWIAEHPL